MNKKYSSSVKSRRKVSVLVNILSSKGDSFLVRGETLYYCDKIMYYSIVPVFIVATALSFIER